MFFEARSDGELGMETVAKNVLTRHKKGYRGASTLCEVVYTKHQYSYIWDNVPDIITKAELPLYNKVLAYSQQLYLLYSNGMLDKEFFKIGECGDGATHYHRWDISPRWSDPDVGSMTQTCGRVGSHIFFVGR